ncbi:hypothetical protein Patl1_14878 [Pistacia atlantica]|uniref:Uncharacterized protein n=1 Tax=Pistacia atlantica TaxID=434234 RepID=A0ACC1AUH3_9ROSI|nr:hypothetical protein Patl1_14878 [Pistacia atlantica]
MPSALLSSSTTPEDVTAVDAVSSVVPHPSFVSQPLGQAKTFQNPTAQNPYPPPVQRLHQMTTRSMNKIFKPKQLNSVSKHPLPESIEPTCVSQALSQPQWRDAMSNELTALMKHSTWDLVPPPLNYNPMGCKWVFRVKRKSDGSVD